jgi:spore germination protein (amino acid permease)
MTLISAATAALGFGIVVILLKRFPGKGLAEIFELSLGRVAGVFVSLFFSYLFLQEASILIREFADVLRTYTFPETSTGLLILAMAATVIVAASCGLESLARLAKLAAWFILGGFLLVLIMAAQDYKVSNLYPILGFGLGKTVTTGMERSSYYGPVVLLAFIAPSLQNFKTVKRAGFITLAISGAVVSISLLCILMLFPYVTGQELTDPMYALARMIKYGYFFTRIDILFIFVWIIASAICISTLFYTAAGTFCKALRLTDLRPVLIPFGILLCALALFPRDMSDIIYNTVQGTREHNWIFYFGLPLLALAAAVLRRKKGVEANA